jgi:hypothetical protein
MLLAAVLPLLGAAASILDGAPIWASTSDDFALLRGPSFALRAAPTAATFFYAAQGSPRPPAGTTQAKLLGAACLYVNAVLVTCGPGHNVPTASQVVRGVDVLPFLRGGAAPNVVGVASFFAHAYAKAGDRPAVQGVLAITDAAGSYNVRAPLAPRARARAHAPLNPPPHPPSAAAGVRDGRGNVGGLGRRCLFQPNGQCGRFLVPPFQ